MKVAGFAVVAVAVVAVKLTLLSVLEGAGEDDRLEREEGDKTFCNWDWTTAAGVFEGEAVPLLKEGIEEKDI